MHPWPTYARARAHTLTSSPTNPRSTPTTAGKRLSNWIRRNRATLVDGQLWWYIQTTYPELVAARQNGVDLDLATSVDAAQPPPTRTLAADGELYTEYQRSLRQLEEQRHREAEAEFEQSRPLLEALAQEEEEAAAVDPEAQARLAEIEQADRDYAQTLQRELEMAAEAEPSAAGPADPGALEADHTFATQLHAALNAPERPAFRLRAEETPLPRRARKPRRRSSPPKPAVKRHSGEAAVGKKSRQLSLAGHVMVISREDGDEAAQGATRTMRKCPLCSEVFVTEVLLEHAAVCDGAGRREPPSPARSRDKPSKDRPVGWRSLPTAQPTKGRADRSPNPSTLDRFVVKSEG